MRAIAFRAKARARWLLSRWPAAEVLNRSERTCWANLVTWALDGGMDARHEVSRGPECQAESVAHKDHACYCGKFTNGCLTRKGQTPSDIS